MEFEGFKITILESKNNRVEKIKLNVITSNQEGGSSAL